tara:strand:+ start:374 stop:1654 length:1281 start_codon:yes stop_codon:yes gene_type:complete
MGNSNLNNIKEKVHLSLKKTGLKNYLVALSGGSDSMLLLRILHELSIRHEYKIRAIHINHNISSNSDEMAKTCKDACSHYNIDIIIKNISVKPKNNIEDNLRNNRYEEIFRSMNQNEALILGHHIDDQVETFFYRLFRGSSPIGLSCIKEFSSRYKKVICRPFLSVSKKMILDCCDSHSIKFVNDITNQDTSFDRNYIRKKIIPVIKERWGSLNKVMIHNISLQNTYRNISIDYCNMIYDHIVVDNKIDINVLKSYPTYIYTIFLKYFISKVMKYELNKNELSSLLSILLTDNNDYPKCILKNKKLIVRYNNFLYIVDEQTNDNNIEKVWDLKADIFFGNNKLSVKQIKDMGVYDELYKKGPIVLKQFKGNEKIKLNRNNHQDLKKIFQDKNVPLWERDRFILLFSNNELLVAYGNKHTFISTELR